MKRPASLWLFDIDGTLVDTGGAGLQAIQDAARECYGAAGPALNLAGSTDSGVMLEIFEHFGEAPSEERRAAFFATYVRWLKHHLGSGDFPGRVLDGVGEVLGELATRPDIAVGLLTGNIEEGARTKMHHFGLNHHFPFGAWGCDHADRNQLGPLALERAARHCQRSFRPEETVIIGDTRKDIACARAVGAHCIAVATGSVPVDELQDADVVLEVLDPQVLWREFL